MGNEEQIEYWNGEAGKRWAQDDDMMARLLLPISEALLDHASVENCRSALDIGCGGGSQSLMLAQRLQPGARVLGVDISGPLLEVARAKTTSVNTGGVDVEFLQADAASHPFEPERFDLLFSRFGVMFFDDPVAAFSNLRGAMTPGGRVAFSCWQAMKSNEWTWIPIQTPAGEARSQCTRPFCFCRPGEAGIHTGRRRFFQYCAAAFQHDIADK